jgi:uncharacterized protein (DUF2235 family)
MKRIIICSDGTWNKPGTTEKGKIVKTNVELLYNLIKRTDDSNGNTITQLRFYETGVGSSTFDFWEKISGGITGKGIDDKIKDLYLFLIVNYEIGDELYFFGFSRGAYTVRSLAGLVRNCGILKPENLNLLDKTFELYRNRNSYTSPDSDMMVGYKKRFSIEETTFIKFIGVWDTVGSLGIPIDKKHNLNKYSFHDVKLSSTINNAFHALALDERRNLFQPTLWEVSSKKTADQNVEQRWFIGSHSNVGGGYSDTSLSDIALKWLFEKAQNIGLKFEDPKLNESSNEYNFKPDYSKAPIDSRTAFFRILPSGYRDYKSANKRVNAKGEPILTLETFDESIYEKIKSDSKYKHVIP